MTIFLSIEKEIQTWKQETCQLVDQWNKVHYESWVRHLIVKVIESQTKLFAISTTQKPIQTTGS